MQFRPGTSPHVPEPDLCYPRRPMVAPYPLRIRERHPAAVAAGGSNPATPNRVIPITTAGVTMSMSKSRFAQASWPE